MDPARWQEVKRLTAKAIELDAGKRPEFLEAACGSDRDLREQIERLLREHESSSGLSELIDSGNRSGAPWRRQPAPMLTKAGPGSKRGPGTGPRTAPGSGDLAPDVIRRSGERLGSVALAYAVLFFVINLINELVVHSGGDPPYRQNDHWVSHGVMMTLIVLSLSIYFLLRRSHIAGSAIITVGLWFEIVGTLGMALAIYAGGLPEDERVVGISWMCVWIVAYPFVVPSPPRKAMAAGFASAAMGPLAIAVFVGAGIYEWPSFRLLLAMFTPLFICALLASAGGRIIYRLGSDLRKAQQLGSYRLESLIGRGGMGEVWVARHHMLARPAALKLIRPERLWEGSAGGSVSELFEREAQNTAALTSAHTIKLYDYGTTDEGVLYYAMELLDGLDLESLVQRFGPLPAERAVHFLEQICQSLAEAHERGLVHRDIKPANIFVCRQGLVHDFVKVLDFGLVQRHRNREAVPGEDERDVDIVGTPGYMAPESLATGEASPQSDLYAVGCVAYWLLTGQSMSQADDPRAAASEYPMLDRVVQQCLEERPSERPPSAASLRAALSEWTPAEPWTQDRARIWWATVASSTPEILAAPA